LFRQQDLRPGRKSDLVTLLDGAQARASEFEVSLGGTQARGRCGQDVTGLFDGEDEILDRLIEGEVCGDELLPRASLASTSAAEVKQIIADLNLRQKGFVANNQCLSVKLDRQLETPPIGIGFNLRVARGL
jgi:hypothetical protein